MNCPYVMRMCRKCGEVKFLFKFVKHKNSKYGFKKECKECKSEYNKKYNQSENGKEVSKKAKRKYEQSEKGKKRKKKYNQSEKGKKVQKEAYEKYSQSEKGKKVQKEKIKKYRQSDKGKKAKRKYEQSEKGQVVQFNANNRRRSKEQIQGNGITTTQWIEMMNFFKWKCAYSDMRIDKNNRSIDHIIALNNGGLNEIWNCVPMYKPYNSSKKTSDMLEWYKQQDFYSEERLQKIYEWQEYAYNKWGKEDEVC